MIEPSILENLSSMLVLLGVGVLIFSLCYTYLPSGTRKIKQQLPGAVLAAIAWLALSFGFRIYVDHSTRFTLFYGSFATIALFLFWLYCIFLILLAGGLVNRYREIYHH